jgi:aldehyde:ferredoxin oxidoreductase
MLGGWPLYVEQIAARAGREEAERVRAAFGPEAYLRLKRGRFACPSCFLADKDVLSLPGGPSCSTSFLNAAILGSALGLEGAEEAASLLDLLDRRGLCFITFFNLCVFLRLAREAGLPASADYAKDISGGYEGWSRLVETITAREGPGEVLAAGWEAVFDHFGAASRRLVAVVKGQDCLYDPRASGLGTMEFEQLVSPRGPTSASAGSPTYLPGQSLENMRRLTSRMGVPEAALRRIYDNPGGFNVGRLTRYSEDWFSLFSCLGVCNRAQINRLYNPGVFHDLLGAATGADAPPRKLMGKAAAAWELYRDLNRREGFTPADDRAPEAWFPEGAGTVPGYFGEPLGREDLERLIEDYCDERKEKP